MKKRLFAFPLTVCILLCCILTALPAHAAGTGGESAVSSDRNGVVRILAALPDGSANLGSGFAVGQVGEPSAVFVTNKHVVENSTAVYRHHFPPGPHGGDRHRCDPD